MFPQAAQAAIQPGPPDGTIHNPHIIAENATINEPFCMRWIGEDVSQELGIYWCSSPEQMRPIKAGMYVAIVLAKDAYNEFRVVSIDVQKRILLFSLVVPAAHSYS